MEDPEKKDKLYWKHVKHYFKLSKHFGMEDKPESMNVVYDIN